MSECPHHASASRGFVDESEVDWDDSHSSASQPDVEPFGSSEASPNIMSERNQRDMSSRPGDFESWLSDLAIDPAVPHSEAPASHKVQSVASETQHSSLKPGGFANVLREAHLSLQDSTPKNFWEQGFWSDFFGSASTPDAILPKFKDRRPEPYQITTCEPSGSIPTSQAKKPRLEFTAVFQKVVINRQLISWRDARESSFEVAILKWIALFGSWESSRDEALDVFSQRTEQMQRTIISDCIARKAPSTALKRANSMLKFTKLATQASLSMPVGEADTYGILHDAKAGGAPLSQLRGFMESITFVRHVFDIKSLDETCVSKRCWGVTVARVATPVRQADPLRVKDLRELHRVLKEDPCAWNRCFAGSGLFCAYGRCRWSDMQHLDGLTFEHENGPRTPLSFVGGILDVHKTMNLQGPQPRVLEIVAPAQGITEDDWASKWIAAREEVGCDWSQGHPTMPAPNHFGEPTVRALGSDECGSWLKALLPTRGELRTTSHSLKATFLSYCAKRGMSHLDRLALGGHSHGAKSADTYARDALARPLRLLQGVIREISQHLFMPDANRAGRLATGPEVSELARELGLAVPRVSVAPFVSAGPLPSLPKEEVLSVSSFDYSPSERVESAPGSAPRTESQSGAAESDHTGHSSSKSSVEGTTSSDSGASSSSDGDSDMRPAAPVVAPQSPSPPEGYKFIQHVSLRTLHYVQIGHMNFTVCGRRITEVLREPFAIRWDTPVCGNCKRSDSPGIKHLL